MLAVAARSRGDGDKDSAQEGEEACVIDERDQENLERGIRNRERRLLEIVPLRALLSSKPSLPHAVVFVSLTPWRPPPSLSVVASPVQCSAAVPSRPHRYTYVDTYTRARAAVELAKACLQLLDSCYK